MKKKQSRKVKRLELSRETLVQLTDQEVEKVQGQAAVAAAVGDCTGCPSGCGIFPDP